MPFACSTFSVGLFSGTLSGSPVGVFGLLIVTEALVDTTAPVDSRVVALVVVVVDDESLGEAVLEVLQYLE